MKLEKHIFIFDEKDGDAFIFAPFLEKHGYHVQKYFEELSMPYFEPMSIALLALPRREKVLTAWTSPQPLIVLSETKELTLSAVRKGIWDYLIKPFDPDRLLLTLKNAFLFQELKHDLGKTYNSSALSLDELEKEMIQQALKRCNGNISRVARELKINPSTIHRKLKKWQDKK